MRKVLTWLALIIAVIWVLHNPGQAASLFHQATSALTTLASSL